MPLWGSSDAASNSTIFAAAQLNKTPNTANRTALFGNTTANAYIAGATVGQFGVDANEIAASGGKAAHTGWVLRTTGQGGRSGRVMQEVLVAGGIASDAEDTVYPDYLIVISSQPEDASANTSEAEEATFTVTAASVPSGATLTYAWTYANGDAIQSGANVGNTTQATLTVNTGVETANVDYKVEISTSGAANVVSTNATLTVTS